MPKSRVVITGLGALTPLANDAPSTWEGLKAGKSGIAPLVKFPTDGFRVRFGGEIKASLRWSQAQESAILSSSFRILGQMRTPDPGSAIPVRLLFKHRDQRV